MNRVELAFRRAADPLLPRDEPLLVAVSGGGDSVALLWLCHDLAARRGMRLTVAHLDHGLRRGSVADRRFVERLARRLEWPCLAERRDVAAERRRDESPEEAARRVRRRFLVEAARRAGATRIATGHTLDDQAETVLMRLARGAGPAALCGMAADGPGPFVRPLLSIERAELRAYLTRRDATFREDPTNHSLRFDRNRVRHLVVPALTEALNPRAPRHLVQAMERLREDAACLDALALEALEAATRPAPDGRGLLLDARHLSALPPPVARRLARAALVRAGADPRRIGSRHLEALVDLAHGGNGRAADLPSRLSARRISRTIHLVPECVTENRRRE